MFLFGYSHVLKCTKVMLSTIHNFCQMLMSSFWITLLSGTLNRLFIVICGWPFTNTLNLAVSFWPNHHLKNPSLFSALVLSLKSGWNVSTLTRVLLTWEILVIHHHPRLFIHISICIECWNKLKNAKFKFWIGHSFFIIKIKEN